MAKIYEEVITVKLSKLVKDDSEQEHESIMTGESMSALEQVVQELTDKNVIVEIEFKI